MHNILVRASTSLLRETYSSVGYDFLLDELSADFTTAARPRYVIIIQCLFTSHDIISDIVTLNGISLGQHLHIAFVLKDK